MSPVETVRCPNCGGTITGTGMLLCPYCGSQLNVNVTGTGRDGFPDRSTQSVIGQEAEFNNLPGYRITPGTTDIPFKPQVIIDKIGGNNLGPQARSDVNAIVRIFETMQSAENREDIELYGSVLADDGSDFSARTRASVKQTYAISDNKRYTTRIRFLRLTPDTALVEGTREVITFIPGYLPGQAEVAYRYELRKISGEWKLVSATQSGLVTADARKGRLILMVALAIFLLGMAAAIIMITSGN